MSRSSSPKNPPSVSSRTSSPGGRRSQTPVPPTEAVPSKTGDNKNSAAFLSSMLSAGYSSSSKIPQRPTLSNKSGREIEVDLNMFAVSQFPSQRVYQYDVLIGNGAEKRRFNSELWNCTPVQSWLSKNGGSWIWDGNALAWSNHKIQEKLFELDTDVIRGRPGGRETKHIRIRFSKVLDMASLVGWLGKTNSFNDSVLESITYLDHLLGETPSRKFIKIKRSFYPDQSKLDTNGASFLKVGQAVQAVKGIFASLRVVLSPSLQPSLAVNVDVANTCFWEPLELIQVLKDMIRTNDVSNLQKIFANHNQSPVAWRVSPLYNVLKRLRRLRVVCRWRNTSRSYIIADFEPVEAKDKMFETPDGNTSVTAHIRRKYDFTPMRNLPIIRTTRKQFIPMDSVFIEENQHYKFKLSDVQTSEMIKFSVTPPSHRLREITQNVSSLSWDKDPVLQHFGMKIQSKPSRVKARVLNAPEVQFKTNKVKGAQCVTGRWRIDGQVFKEPNAVLIDSIGYCMIRPDGGRGPQVNEDACLNFHKKFLRIYKGHGGLFSNNVLSKNPPFIKATPANGPNITIWAWNGTGKFWNIAPKLLFFVVPTKDSETYKHIKRGCDTRYGVASQVLQWSHVSKAQDQYISNVCMKVNAKLGGATCRSLDPNGFLAKTAKFAPYNTSPTASDLTMVIGADVSHGGPESTEGSIAAITLSMDKQLLRYCAHVNTNGLKIEMITPENWAEFFDKKVREWVQRHGKLPTRVFYLRDGVSEHQYSMVLEQEVSEIRNQFLKLSSNKANVQLNVMIATKRHHVRFFPVAKPGSADKNGNPLPGTLVESGAAHPFEFDWFLCSHSAIKGTARPMHYYLLLNESKIPPPELQQMIFEHCFQYARATTPVSMHPAIYYAHLASKRAEAHFDTPFVSSAKKEMMVKVGGPQAGGSRIASESIVSGESQEKAIKPLKPLMTNGAFTTTMWYI